MMELEEMKQLWQQHDAALKESRRVNEALVSTMIQHQSTGKLGKMKVMEYANVALCGFLVLIGLLAIPKLNFRPEIIATYPICMLLLITHICWSIYKLNFMNSMDFAGKPVVESVAKMKRLQLMTQKELTVMMPCIVLAIVVFLPPVHQLVHGNNITAYLRAYIYAAIPAIILAVILIYWFYRKLIMPHLKQITQQLEDIRQFREGEA
jgi:hypothetical protein